MKPKLPRIMLWTDITSIEVFLREPINQRLYDFYLELHNVRWHLGHDDSAVLLFNEIYYQLTKVEYECNLDINLDEYIQETESKASKEHCIIFVYKMIFAFLLLRQNNSIAALNFRSYIFYRYNRIWDERTNCAFGSIIKDDKKYLVELKPSPCRVSVLEDTELQWDEITNDFNPSSIKEVLALWSSNEEKIVVLNLIEEAYKRISRRPVKILNNISDSMLRIDYSFFSNMYSELGGKSSRNNVRNPQVIDNNIDQTLLNYPFVIKQDLAVVVIEKLRDLIKGKSSPKDKMMPIRAAQDAGVIRRPTYGEMKNVFGENFISNSSYHNYTNPGKKPFSDNNSFDLMVNEFVKLIV